MVWPTGDPAFTSNRAEVSRCCASHLSCLPKISNQQKGTLSGADASHRFPVLLARPGAAGTRFAQTAGCFIPAVLRCSALRPRGEYSRPSSGKLARSPNYRLLRFVHNQDALWYEAGLSVTHCNALFAPLRLCVKRFRLRTLRSPWNRTSELSFRRNQERPCPESVPSA
jgi:hypothetical protein